MTGFPKPSKRIKEKKPLKRKKRSPLAIAKERANTAYSLYIRTLNSVDGVNQCYTCGKILAITKEGLHAGHGIAGRNNAILYMEEITKPQCMGCNVYGRGQYAIFTRKLIEELGMDRYDEIVKLSGKSVKYKIYDYQEIEAKYIELLKNL